MSNNIAFRLFAPPLVAAFFVSMMLGAHVRPAAAVEAFEDKTEGFHQCVIAVMRGTRSITAVQIMENACQKVWYEGTMMRESEKQAYVCLLRSLPGVDNDYAASARTSRSTIFVLP